MAEVFGIKFAPLSIPLHRRLETLAVLFHLFIFVVFPFVSLFTCFYLLFYTKFWWLVLLYAAWFVYDFKTPSRGSRPMNWFRRLPLWTYYRDYFPLKLVKTADFDPNKNYIVGCHPHGIISLSIGNLICSESDGLSVKFPGINFLLCTLNSQFYFPLRREYYMACGAVEVSKESIKFILNRSPGGNAAVIVVGGAAEALDAFPGEYIITLNNRKGFIKMALQNGASLVPVVSFGENDLYDQIGNRAGSVLRFLQTKMKGFYSYSLPLFYGRGVFNYSFGLMPHRKPVFTVVGKPIDVKRVENPNQEDIDSLHSQYKAALLKLFNDNKLKYGVPETTEMIIK